VNELPGRRTDSSLVDRYEQLRARALSGAPDGWRHGLGLVIGRGLPAWMTVATDHQPRPSTSTSPAPPLTGLAGTEVVNVLAAMALAHT
jgi:hypothetical protein